MSEIKLKEESMEDTLKNKVSGARLDFDENSNPFYRLTMYLKEPHTNIEYYMELNKNDSKELIIQKEDGNYVEEENVKYLHQMWRVDLNSTRLLKVWKEGEKGIDIPEEWWDEGVTSVPFDTAMWDEVFVDKEKVKIDYNITVVGNEADRVTELVTKIKEKFPNEKDFYVNDHTIIGEYLDNHTIRPPYKSHNTVTLYYMYYDKTEYKKLLEEYKVPHRDLYSYKFWYGHKYDIDSSKRLLKVVIQDSDAASNYQKHPDSFIPRPQLPVCMDAYFAKIYSEDGTEANEYDVFFSTTYDIMQEYCEKNNLKFPLPDNRIHDHVWVFGLVYDKNTLEIKQTKAYVKVVQNPENWFAFASSR